MLLVMLLLVFIMIMQLISFILIYIFILNLNYILLLHSSASANNILSIRSHALAAYYGVSATTNTCKSSSSSGYGGCSGFYDPLPLTNIFAPVSSSNFF